MKHEQALIVVLAYLIGFSTAFIAFGLDNVKSYKPKPDSKPYTTQLPVKSAAEERGEARIGIAIREEGLYALLSDRDRIISAQSASLIATESGYHHQVIKTEVSPNNQYIYYCVQLVATSSDCANFVFDVDEDVVYKVSRADGEQIMTPATLLVAAWTSDNLLTINNFVSASKAEPWRVVER